MDPCAMSINMDQCAIKECIAVLIGLYKKYWCGFMYWNWFSLEVVTLPCQNLACSGPICTKQKTLFKLAKSMKVHYLFVKVAPLVHLEK